MGRGGVWRKNKGGTSLINWKSRFYHFPCPVEEMDGCRAISEKTLMGLSVVPPSGLWLRCFVIQFLPFE